jgi:uncharacterized cupredoxin-like copper-binding protein
MSKTSRRTLLAVISTLAFVAAACGDDDAADPALDTSAASPDTSAASPDTSAASPDTSAASPDTSAASPDTSAASSAGQYVANAAEFVDAADWDTAGELTIELTEMAFTPSDITLEAGKPYILKVVNIGAEKHEFTADEFFRTVATRKAETAESEVKVPFFTEIEVFAGATVELFVIPLIPGTYDLKCLIEGHFEAGMFGTITVTGETPTSPALELADDASGPWVQDGPAIIEAADFDAAGALTIDLTEMAFTPNEIALEAGKPYIIKVVNKGEVKHEFTAEEFFQTVAFRKAEDASGEFKAPAPHEIEVFPGKEIDVYLVPTKDGVFDLVCKIEGHFEAGMFGTITVAPAT